MERGERLGRGKTDIDITGVETLLLDKRRERGMEREIERETNKR